MNTVYLALGTNIGNRTANLELVHRLISQRIGIVLKESSTYQTAPWGVEEQQEDYYNQVFCVKTSLDPMEVWHQCQVIEKKMGRLKTKQWAPRIIDIDILFFNDLVLMEEELKIPHPRLHERNFVLKPMCEIANEWKHPILGQTIEELLGACADELPAVALNLVH